MADSVTTQGTQPLADLDEWDADVRRRYPQPHQPADFRNYDEGTRGGVREFYRLNHRGQTVEFNRAQREKYLPLRQRRMSVWEAIDCLNAIVDTSDPDTELPQIDHAIQTAEAIRAAGHPRWFVLVGPWYRELVDEFLPGELQW